LQKSQEESYKYDQNRRVLAERYERIKLVLELISGTVVPLLACLFLLLTGASQILSQSLMSMTDSYWAAVAAYVISFLLFLHVVELPFSFYSGFVVDHRFGLSRQLLRDWASDAVKELGLEGVFGVILGLVLYYLIRATELWWFAAAVLFAIFSIVLSIILPYLIMPIFYRVTALSDTGLKESLIAMVRKVGAKDIDRVLVADESRRSIRANAMFSGIGRSKAIVVFDTLVDKFTRRETVTVVAHELGHYVNKDVWKSALVSGFFAIPPFFIADRVLRFSRGVASSEIANPAGFPIIFGIFIAVSFVLQPLSNWISRRMESQADWFALEAAEDPDAQASAERRLADMDLSVDRPKRLVELLFYTHPPSSKRIEMAEKWKQNHAS